MLIVVTGNLILYLFSDVAICYHESNLLYIFPDLFVIQVINFFESSSL